jgi:hypothetical protein
MLEIAHEVVITSVKSYQPHTHKCTCSQIPSILSCANKCVSQASQSSIEENLIENNDLKEEVERLKKDVTQLKGEEKAQPSQDNRVLMQKWICKHKGLIPNPISKACQSI